MRLGTVRRDWLKQLCLMCSIYANEAAKVVQDLCTSCRVPVNLFHFIVAQSGIILAQFLCKSCRVPVILFYLILAQGGKILT